MTWGREVVHHSGAADLKLNITRLSQSPATAHFSSFLHDFGCLGQKSATFSAERRTSIHRVVTQARKMEISKMSTHIGPTHVAASTQAPKVRTLAEDSRNDRSADPNLVIPSPIRDLAKDMFIHTHPETGEHFYMHKYGEAVHPAPKTGGPRDLGRTRLNDRELRVCILGDSGTGTIDQHDVALGIQETVKKNNSHAILHMGDALYDNGLRDVEDRKFDDLLVNYYGDIQRPIYLALGNHEYGNAEGTGSVQALLARANSGEDHHVVLPSRYYRFGFELEDHTAIDFFVLDTSVISSEPEQLAWLREQLSSSDAKYKLVYGHHPMHSYGLHGDLPHLQKLLLPLLEKHASAYLCGHEHDQQVLQSDGGLPLLVTGTAGEARDTQSGPRTHYSGAHLGFATLHVNAAAMDLTLRDHKGDAVFHERWRARPTAKPRTFARLPQLQALESRL